MIFYLITIFAAALSHLQTAANAIEDPLKELANLALIESPVVQAAALRVEQAQLGTENADSALWPSLDLNTVHGVRDSTFARPDNSDLISRFELSLREQFYNAGLLRLQIERAELAARASELQKQRTVMNVFRDMAQTYYDLSAEAETLEIQKLGYELLTQQSSLVRRQYEQGLKTRTDFLRFRSELRRADLNLVTSQNRILSLEIQLVRICGSPKALDVKRHTQQKLLLGDIALPTPPDLTENISLNLSKLDMQGTALTTKGQRIELGPMLTLNAGANYGAAGYLGQERRIHDVDSLDWNVSVGLQYNLWDWGIRRNNVYIAKKGELVADQNYRTTKLQQEEDAARLKLQFDRLAQEYSLSQELLTIEEETFSALQSEYRQGLVTFVDLIRGLDSLNAARTGLINVYYSIKKSLVDLNYIEGQLDEWTSKIE